MKDQSKIKYNLLTGIFGQIITLLLGIFIPRLVLTSYGSEMNGLLASITNIYAYIAIVEAGIAAASCQALYKPLSQKDTNRVNAILAAANRYYHRAGLIYLFAIFCFSAIYPALIHTEIPYLSIVLIIFFNGIGNVILFFFHGKYLILLRSDGKNYVRTSVELGASVANQLFKIILILLGYDIVLVQLAATLICIVQMVCITVYIKKNYHWLDLSVAPDFSAVSQSKYVFVHEINYLITSNVDTILLTIFTTLKTVSVYSMYTMFLNIIAKVIQTVRESLEFKIAYIYHESLAEFQRVFKAFETYYITFVFAMFSVVNYFILPFLSLYTKGVNDVNYINPTLPFLFILIQLLSAGRYPVDAMIHIAGHFKQTQKSASIESVINLLFSILLVRHFGIAGVLIGTILSSLFRTNYLILYVNKKILFRNALHTYASWLINFSIYFLLSILNQFILPDLSTYSRIFFYCILYTIFVFLLYFGIVSAFQPRTFSYIWNLFKKLLTH